MIVQAQTNEGNGRGKPISPAGIVLTGGVTKIEGLRELAIAIFDNMPVRLAKPTDMGGLFDTLRDPAYSGAVGLIKYMANGYTPYEIDVNKRMRHAGEELPSPHQAPMHEEIPEFDLPSAPPVTEPVKEEKKTESPKMVNIESRKADQSDQPNPISKFWNWATQLF